VETSIREETDELWKGGVHMAKSQITTCIMIPFYVQWLSRSEEKWGDCHKIVGVRTEKEDKLGSHLNHSTK
jgi:hypothetical protein